MPTDATASTSTAAGQKRRTPRQVAREANLARIKDLALEQLATDGAAGLSLRAIARELNLVSSAIYRYYPSRDDLVTDLVIDAYRDLAAALTEATGGRTGRDAWVEVCQRLRVWALAEPHRYLLVYGSPIPGYEAPQTTVEPAAAVVRALMRPAWSVSGQDLGGPIPPRLADELDAVASALGEAGAERATALRLVGAVAKVHGLVMLEVNGQFVGGFEPADQLFRAAVEDEAERLGLV